MIRILLQHLLQYPRAFGAEPVGSAPLRKGPKCRGSPRDGGIAPIELGLFLRLPRDKVHQTGIQFDDRPQFGFDADDFTLPSAGATKLTAGSQANDVRPGGDAQCQAQQAD